MISSAERNNLLALIEGTRKLNGILDSFRSRVRVKDAIELLLRQKLQNSLRQLNHRSMHTNVHLSMNSLRRLILNRLNNLRVAVTSVGDRNATHKVQILESINIVDIRTYSDKNAL